MDLGERLSSASAGARTGAGLLVLALHLAALAAWWGVEHTLPAMRPVAALAPLTVWLPPLRVALAEPRERTPPASPQPPSHPRPPGAQAPDPVQDGAVQPSAAPPNAEGAALEASPQFPSALNLSLPRKALASPGTPSAAALSPFHGRLPATVEQIIANAAAESGPWSEERIDDDHIRLRRGNTCVLMERPQAAALDPFSDAARRLPWRASVTRC